jgi:hypothetical protein
MPQVVPKPVHSHFTFHIPLSSLGNQKRDFFANKLMRIQHNSNNRNWLEKVQTEFYNEETYNNRKDRVLEFNNQLFNILVEECDSNRFPSAVEICNLLNSSNSLHRSLAFVNSLKRTTFKDQLTQLIENRLSVTNEKIEIPKGKIQKN